MGIIDAVNTYEKAKVNLKNEEENLKITQEQYRDRSIIKIKSLNLEDNNFEARVIGILKTSAGKIILPYLCEQSRATFLEIYTFYNKTDKGPPNAIREAIQDHLTGFCSQGLVKCLDDSKPWDEREFILTGISDCITNKPVLP